MYAILLPVISATDLTLKKHDSQREVSVCAVIGGFRSPGLCQFLCVCGLSLLAVILIKGNEKRNRKRQEKGSKYD